MMTAREMACVRRARPWLGTLVDVRIEAAEGLASHATELAFDAIARVQARMSVFEQGSDLARLHAAKRGEPVEVDAWTAEVLALAQRLHAQSQGRFDVALGTGRWRLDAGTSSWAVTRLDASTRIDLGGLAKGWAVDRAVDAAVRAGAKAVCVNAGGDLRAHGCAVSVSLRDERDGGVAPWLALQDGAMATSDFGPSARSRLHEALPARCAPPQGRHLSVAAPCCAHADGLTKVIASLGSVDHPLARQLLRHYGAQAWIHDDARTAP